MNKTKIGEYRLVRQITVRGTEEEWLVQSVTGAYLLLEMLRGNIIDQTLAESALRLYQPISRRHQNLETILHAGLNQLRKSPFYVTELTDDLSGLKKFNKNRYVPATLSSLVAHNGRLEIESCVNIALDIADALACLHSHGLVHRNLKPARIRFLRKVPKISGVWLIGEIGSNVRVGTASYTPPEGHGFPKGDLYGLGKTLEQIASDETKSSLSSDIQDAIKNRWSGIVSKLCHHDPNLRYASALEVTQELLALRNFFEPTKESQFYSCFISYSHKDYAFAVKLFEALRNLGVQCWLDQHQLLPGDDLHSSIDRGVRLWDKVLLCCSESSLESWWVDKEIQKALMKEEQLWKERGQKTLAIIPLNLDGHLFSPEWKAKQDWKEQHLTSRLAADFTGWEKDNAKFEAQFERVVKALRADGATREKVPKTRL